jgi:hydrogenase maturation protease
MATPSGLKILIIGIGNPFRSDDAAGLCVVRSLKEAGFNTAMLVEHSGEGAALMETWKGAEAVILIDAVSSGAAPGTLHRLEPLVKPLPAAMFQHSTHAFSIPQAIELSRALNQLPARLVLFGIEGKDFQAGEELSPEVAGALPKITKQVTEEIRRLRSQAESQA